MRAILLRQNWSGPRPSRACWLTQLEAKSVATAGGTKSPRSMLLLVALGPRWRQEYPNNRPPTRANAISEMGQRTKPLAL